MMALVFTGCISVDREYSPVKTGEPILEEVEELKLSFLKSFSEKDFNRLILATENQLSKDPSNRKMWIDLSNQLILKGTAFETSTVAKRKLYLSAMAAAVEAMKTNREFLQYWNTGAQPWELTHLMNQSD